MSDFIPFKEARLGDQFFLLRGMYEAVHETDLAEKPILMMSLNPRFGRRSLDDHSRLNT
jgi:hypothetical protein